MRKKSIYSLLLLLAIFLYGCTLSAETNPSIEPEVPSITTPNVFFSDFAVPEGYITEEETERSIVIKKDGQIIGGVILTDLDPACLENTESEEVSEYLDSLASSPLIAEYLNMYSDGIIHTSLAITNSETGERKEQRHHLFEYKSVCFDYWYDSASISEDEGHSIGQTVIYSQKEGQ